VILAAAEIANAPPMPVVANYPVALALVATVMLTAVVVVIAGRFDPTQGTLTISTLIIVAFIGTTAFCLFFNVPTDEVTPAVVGGLTAGFGAVVAYWLGRPREALPPAKPAKETPPAKEGPPAKKGQP
jgi:hypothetical protein